MIDSTSESSTATDRLSDSARKNWPGTPESSPSGANTTTVVSVELTSGAISCWHRVDDAGCRLRRARRWMFSTTTTASSMTRPMATARPPIDIRLIVPPNSRMKTNVGITASGSVTAAISVRRQSRRKTSSTTMARKPPMRIASRTLAIDSLDELGEVVDLRDA